MAPDEDRDPMDIRKLQLTGGSSIAITLPKRWVERASLKAGDTVGCMVRQDGTLLITPRPSLKRSAQRLELELGNERQEELFRRLVGAYLSGHDIIHISSKKPLTSVQRNTVRNAVRRAIGLEVVDEGPSGLTIQDFLDPTEFPLEKGLRRMATIAQIMHTDAMNELGGPGRRPDEPSMDERDSEVDRLYWLINKQYHGLLRDTRLAERMSMTSSQALNFLLVARLVERTADHAKRISDNVAELQGARLDPRLVAKIHKLSEQSLAIFKDGISAFFRKDVSAANEAIERAKPIHDAKRGLVHEVMDLKGPRAVALAYLLESVERTASYGADVGEIAINHAVAAAAGE